MGLFTDVNQKVNIEGDKRPVVLKSTKNGGIIVCPECGGTGKSQDYPDYGYKIKQPCDRCKGKGAVKLSI